MLENFPANVLKMYSKLDFAMLKTLVPSNTFLVYVVWQIGIKCNIQTKPSNIYNVIGQMKHERRENQTLFFLVFSEHN